MNFPLGSGWITGVVGIIVCGFLGGVAARILFLMWSRKDPDRIDLSAIVSETNGEASMSRLQLLIFTFVIAISMLMMVEKNGFFPFISNGVLLLLGISASTYAVGKSISYSEKEGRQKPDTIDPREVERVGAEAGAAAGARRGAAAGAVTGAQTGAAAGASTGAQTGAETGAMAGAATGAQTGAIAGAEAAGVKNED